MKMMFVLETNVRIMEIQLEQNSTETSGGASWLIFSISTAMQSDME
jgi:hypothetical protein